MAERGHPEYVRGRMSSIVRRRDAPSVDKPRVIAVTGAASFLGSRLVGLLESDDRVAEIVAIDVRTTPRAGPKTRSFEVDLTLPAAETQVAEILATERADTVAHLAFLSSPTYATAWAHELESVGTMRVTVAAREARVRKFVLWSHTWLYGARPSNPNFLSEDHPLRAPAGEPFFADKIEAEEQVRKLENPGPGGDGAARVTILRGATILGPTVRNAFTQYLSRKLVPTMMGFDPLVQFLHEADAVAALHLAVMDDAAGTFNIVSEGVLPLSTAIRLVGRTALPIPPPMAGTIVGLGWVSQLVEAPPTFLKYLRFLCVADGRKAAQALGFRPARSCRDALLDFASAHGKHELARLSEANA